MLNNPNARSEYTVQKGVAPYPVGFWFQFNGDDTPQVKVKIGDVVPRLNVDYEFSDDYSTLILIPTEEETKAPGFKYDDYLWMNRWVGKKLVIERDVPFVQESDYQLGRISPERIEKDFDLSVMRDQILQQQITDNDADIKSLFDTDAEHREDIDHAQDSADAAMAHSVALEKRVAVNETGIATNKTAAARAQKTADDAMAHSVAVEKRVSQNEKNIASNDKDIASLFNEQASHNERISSVESGKIDKHQGVNNVGKVMTVEGDGVVRPRATSGTGGLGVVAHDDSLFGAGTDDYPLGVKNKVTITIVEH